MKTISVLPRSVHGTTNNHMPVSIEIFGVKGYVYDSIRSLLQERLDLTGIEYGISDMQQIDVFIAEGIESVPAVRVNHKTLFTKKMDAPPEEIVNAVVDHVLGLSVQQIICPVDFSEHSIHAASWALKFAKLLNMQLRLVHVARPITEISYGHEDIHAEMVSHLEQKLIRTAREISLQTSSVPLTHVEIGDPLQTIVRLSKAPSTALVIMGTQGITSLTRKLFGTISASVARHTYAPLLLIPPGIEFKKPENILIAFHEELVSNGAFHTLLEFNRSVHAQLRFLHIQNSDDYHEIRDTLAEMLIRTSLPPFSFDIHEIRNQSGSVLETLMSYADQMQPDIIAFVTRHRNVIRNFLRPGLTQKIHARLKWPLLVLHNH